MFIESGELHVFSPRLDPLRVELGENPCSPPGSINIEFLTELHCLVSVIIFACHAFAPARAGWLDSGPIKYASILEK